MEKLVPSNPEEVMVIRDITPNIATCSLPFARFGHVKLGGRGTIGARAVKLSSGSLAVFSPVALTTSVRAKLSQMAGPVRYLVAPDYEHHIYLGPYHDAYPDAHVIGPEGLAEKRAKDPQMKDIPISTVFTQANKHSLSVTPEFDADFEVEYIHSHANKELVFFYKPDKTLIEADALFNLPATEQYSRAGISASSGILTRLFMSLNGTAGRAMGQRRFLWWAISARDRPSFNQSVRRIEKWDFKRIIPCHGDVIETDAKGIFRKVFEWHLEAARNQ